jgi:5-carboxymethyl-2-hydroxymuconate isomerase
MKKIKTRMEVMEKIISERQPITLGYIRQRANSYKEWRGSKKDEMYGFIKQHFSVDEKNQATLKNYIDSAVND